MASPDIETLEAKCLCGSVHFTIDVPKQLLPFRAHLCHCSLCRFSLGAPCVFHVPLPASVAIKFVAPSSAAAMTSYAVAGGRSSGNFCSTCGCHITCIGHETGNWTVSNSIFTDHGPDKVGIARHIYSKSVKDEGLAKLVPVVGGRECVVYNPPEDSPKAKLVESAAEVGDDGKDRMRAECHCGGVSLTFPRPTKEVLEDEYMAQFVSHRDKSKWHACFDLCDDCRLANGAHAVGWTFIPLALCEPSIGPDLVIGTAKTYSSSPGVLRSFCGTCGATVFYAHEDRRPSDRQQVVDLSVGVLRAPEGLMAESWLTWRARPAWLDSGKRFDSDFAEALEAGMNKYVLERDGEVEDYNIG